jgi:hypothetical protein
MFTLLQNLTSSSSSSSQSAPSSTTKDEDSKASNPKNGEDDAMREALERTKKLAADKAKSVGTTRPKLVLKKKQIKNDAMTGGIAWMKYAKGPDGTIGFKRRRSKRKRNRKKKEDKEEVKESEISDSAMKLLQKFRTAFLDSEKAFPKSNKDAVRFLASVRRIDMRNHVLNRENVSDFSHILSWCGHLEHLNIYGQNLGVNAWDLLVVLCRCRELKSLDLSANYIGDTGVILLADILRQCHHLSKIGLCWNHVCDEGMMALMNRVMRSDSFEILDARYNGVSAMLKGQVVKVVGEWKELSDGKTDKRGLKCVFF